MQKDLWFTVHPLLADCCTALFESYGVTVQCDGEVDFSQLNDEGMAAFIGFLGDTIRGALVIGAPSVLIAQALPSHARGARVSDEDQRDWAGELANQLLGRMKIKLAMYGIEFEMSTPCAVVGNDLRSFKSVETSRVLQFSAGEQRLYVEFDVQTTPEFRFFETPLPEEAPIQAGELLMIF
jgi:CheY-specific phosphatase CheX